MLFAVTLPNVFFGQRLEAILCIVRSNRGQEDFATVVPYLINDRDTVIRMATRNPNGGATELWTDEETLTLTYLISSYKLDETYVIYPPGDLGIVELKPGEAAELPGYRLRFSEADAKTKKIEVRYSVAEDLAKRYRVIACELKAKAHIPHITLPALKDEMRKTGLA